MPILGVGSGKHAGATAFRNVVLCNWPSSVREPEIRSAVVRLAGLDQCTSIMRFFRLDVVGFGGRDPREFILADPVQRGTDIGTLTG